MLPSLGTLPLAQLPCSGSPAPSTFQPQSEGPPWGIGPGQLAGQSISAAAVQPAVPAEAALRQQDAASSSSPKMLGNQSRAARQLHDGAADVSMADAGPPGASTCGRAAADTDVAVLTAAARLWVDQDHRECCKHLRSLPECRQQVSCAHSVWTSILQHVFCEA